MHSKTLLASLLAPAAVSAVLNDLAVRAGLKYFGSALGEGPFQTDSTYAAILGDTTEFGQVVPENGMKWDNTEATQGVFTYGNADVSAGQAKKSGQVLRCHTLVWHSQLPSWVSSGSWTVETLTAVMQSHISNVMGHYKGRCYAWDVVNEAIGDDGNWRPSVFLSTFNGTDFIPLAFNLAKAADPSAKLYFNEYNLEYNGAKTDKAVELVKLVQAAGAPIDGVGFQGHLLVAGTPSRSSIATALQRFTALGVEVAFTELDIRHTSLPAPASAYVTQGNDYASVVGGCLDTPNCVGVTVWGVTDKYSWIPGTFSGQGDALLYDANYTRKAAWTSVSSVLAARATLPPTSSACGSTTVTVTATATAVPSTVTVTATPITVTATATPITVTATVTPSHTSTAPVAIQTLYGQCGGRGYTGPSQCGPYTGTCKVQNDWYYQCV